MAADFTGRVWKIPSANLPVSTTFGKVNWKFKGGQISATTGGTFVITDEAGRSYTFTVAVGVTPIYELGWLSGDFTFSGTFVGEVDLFLGTK